MESGWSQKSGLFLVHLWSQVKPHKCHCENVLIEPETEPGVEVGVGGKPKYEKSESISHK